MESMKIGALLAFFVVLAQGCDFSMEKLEGTAMACAARHVFLLEKIMELQTQAKPDVDMDFFCEKRMETALADVYSCVLKKFEDEGCIPPEAQKMMQFMPTKQKIVDALNFVCKHKKVLSSGCMNAHIQEFMQCYMGRVAQLSTTNLVLKDPKTIVCKVIGSEEQCLRENHGTCSDAFVNFLIELLELLFPMADCPKGEKATEKVDNFLKNILIHGAPQGAGPLLYKPMVIKN